ncbi:disks large homolog 1 isoform X2 [Melanotaenia boesemani]|uniref:disks large homolog 1 isoform X2 n=1 Tax=Melanotaenia boesemani TaxID=1250792 RepID=UPI001C04EC91|nr:disks large homolog 1 isoform X2 [Melanotaenia boesemani]
MPLVTGSLTSSVVPEKESLISQVPLKLQIKVSGQRGSLGISIAGGKGSLPYKDHDEGIFISRVAKGGPSEKAGIHVGDRLLEVNGLSMQGATHHEAVGALRNAGSCIKMKVSDLKRNLHRAMSELEAEVSNKGSLQREKHTMAIPRIILTHPSTSDEDVELLTQIPRRELQRDVDDPDSFLHSDCCDSAFYPP